MDYIEVTKEKIGYKVENSDVCKNCTHSKDNDGKTRCHVVPFESFAVSPVGTCIMFEHKPIR